VTRLRWNTAGESHGACLIGILEGMPAGIHLDLEPLDLQVSPVAWSPVLLTSPDGRESRFPRALARFAEADGRTGVGWIERNQPPPPA